MLGSRVTQVKVEKGLPVVQADFLHCFFVDKRCLHVPAAMRGCKALLLPSCRHTFHTPCGLWVHVMSTNALPRQRIDSGGARVRAGGAGGAEVPGRALRLLLGRHAPPAGKQAVSAPLLTR